ncbi:MAG: FAD/FMN-dependent dehydrogenase [Acidimicrobiales bacterium]|nr:FAD/FMN-dependent dehydrogenase [Acidimicrobiales bacterium]
MADITGLLSEIVGHEHVLTGAAISDDYGHDEAMTATACLPEWVVRPGSTAEVASLVALAGEHALPLTARGSGTGLSGACIPSPGGLLVSFERMAEILEIDLDNHVAVVQPGVTLDQLDEATAAHGLVYPVFPGESSASLGGNVATNAGGMRAVKYGVTRHQVLGLEAVLGTGEVIRTGGKFVKATTGYDLTQLIIGSEGTLAIATEAILRLYPRPRHAATLLAPFRTLEEITTAVPRIVASGIGPLMVEYIDLMSMAGITAAAGLDLGVPEEIRNTALAYLVVVLEDRREDRLEEDTEELAGLAAALGALDVYVLPPQAGAQLIEAREKAFWTAKAAGANDIVDMVVPRAAIPAYMAEVSAIANASGSLVVGCGHAGDGNVHLSVFQPDAATRDELLHGIFAAGMALGGAISGEHGIGSEKRHHFEALEDPNKVALMRRIKVAFDPHGILNPGTIFHAEPIPDAREATAT